MPGVVCAADKAWVTLSPPSPLRLAASEDFIARHPPLADGVLGGKVLLAGKAPSVGSPGGVAEPVGDFRAAVEDHLQVGHLADDLPHRPQHKGGVQVQALVLVEIPEAE